MKNFLPAFDERNLPPASGDLAINFVQVFPPLPAPSVQEPETVQPQQKGET